MNREQFEVVYQTLTDRQKEVLHLFLSGRDDEEIAAFLHITEDAVRKHISAICSTFRLTSESSGRHRAARSKLAILVACCNPELIPGFNSGNTNQEGGTIQQRRDYGEMPYVSGFFGRTEELNRLEQWILDEGCQLVTFYGMGGIGKTFLAAKLVERIQTQFQYVIWRSLKEAPLLEDILTYLIQFLQNQQEIQTNFLDSLGSRISQLIKCLRVQRCLLVLDNVESIMQEGCAGCYREGYEGYEELLKQVGQADHQSCLVLISRENPREIELLVRKPQGRSLQLPGLQVPDIREIFVNYGSFSGSDNEWRELITYYAGNPLALILAGRVIQETLNGDISQFIAEYLVSGFLRDVSDLFEQQFNRLSTQEKEITYWLAINREPVSVSELRETIASKSNDNLLDNLFHLRLRSFIETTSTGFTLQPVLMKYVTDKFVKQVVEDIRTGELRLFKNHVIIKAQAKDYLKDIQDSLILKPIMDELLNTFENPKLLEEQLGKILCDLQNASSSLTGYAGGNLLNLFRYLGTNLRGYDFSNLSIWQADIRNIKLHNVRFLNSHFKDCIFSNSMGSILWVVFSPSGKFLATGDVNGRIYLWDVANNKFRYQLLNPYSIFDRGSSKGHNGWVWSLRFSPDERYLASAGDDKIIIIWDFETQQFSRILRGHNDTIRSLSFNQRNILASASDDKTVKIWDITTGECIRTINGHDTRIRTVSFSPTGQTLASAGDDKTVKIWDITTGELIKTLRGHRGEIRTISFSPTGQIIAGAGNDTRIRLWNVESGECIQSLTGHNDWVRSVDFNRDGEFLASASEDQTVKLWDVSSGTCLNTLRGHTSWVQSVRFSPDGRTLASGGADRMVKIWDIDQGCLATLQGYANCVFSIAFSPDGKRLASGHEDRTVRLWDLTTLECQEFLGHQDWVRSVTFSSNGRHLASSSGDRIIRLWNLETEESKTFSGHESWIRQVRFSPDDRILASCSDDRTVRLWDIETQRCIQTLEGHSDWVRSIAFSPDGNILASASGDRTVKLWDIGNRNCIQVLEGHNDWVWFVTFSPNKNILASASGDGTINIWELSNGRWRQIQTLTGHENSVRAVAFNSDGTLLASGSIDTTVRLWDTRTWECIGNPRRHSDWIRSVAFSGAGHLASASQDGVIQLWDLPSDKCITRISLPNLYEGMDITGATGLTSTQIATLRVLGAKKREEY